MAGERDPLSADEIQQRLAALPEWKHDGKALVRIQTFPAYKDALDFVYQVGLTAEAEDHHPDIVMNFKRVEVKYWTHTARGVTALDFRLAALVERLVERFYHPRKG